MQSETDKCFMCLASTTERVCKQCKCMAHPECWAEYKTKCATKYMCPGEGYYNYTCPVCKTSIEDDAGKKVWLSEKKFSELVSKRAKKMYEQCQQLRRRVFSWNQEDDPVESINWKEGFETFTGLVPEVSDLVNEKIRELVRKDTNNISSYEKSCKKLIRMIMQ